MHSKPWTRKRGERNVVNLLQKFMNNVLNMLIQRKGKRNQKCNLLTSTRKRERREKKEKRGRGKRNWKGKGKGNQNTLRTSTWLLLSAMNHLSFFSTLPTHLGFPLFLKFTETVEGEGKGNSGREREEKRKRKELKRITRSATFARKI